MGFTDLELSRAARDEIRDRAVGWIHRRRDRLGAVALDAVLSICRQFADLPGVWKAAEGLAGCVNIGHGLDGIREVVDSLLSNRSSWPPQGEAALLRIKAGCHWAYGELGDAIGLAGRAVELSAGLADTEQRVAAGNDLSRYLLQCGDITAAKYETLAVLERVDRERDPKAWATAMSRLSSIQRCEGDFAAAESAVSAALKHSRDYDDVHADAWCNLALLHRDAARGDEVVKACGELIERAGSMSSPRFEATARGILAEALLVSGRPRDALSEVEAALDALRVFWCRAQIHEVSLVKARVLAVLGDTDGALALVAQSDLFFSGRESHRAARAEIELTRARVLAEAGRHMEAVGPARRAAKLYEAMPHSPGRAAALSVAAQAHRVSKDSGRVRGLRECVEEIPSGRRTVG